MMELSYFDDEIENVRFTKVDSAEVAQRKIDRVPLNTKIDKYKRVFKNITYAQSETMQVVRNFSKYSRGSALCYCRKL